MATLVVTGAQRPVAANLAVVLSSAFDVIAVSDPAHHSANPAQGHLQLQNCQVVQTTNAAQLSHVIRDLAPDAVLHCGVLSEGAWRPLRMDPNTDSAVICAAAQAACHVEAHFTMLSTDAIFDRPSIFHAESSAAQSRLAPMIRSLETAALEWGGLVVRTHALAWGTGHGSSTLGDDLYSTVSGGGRLGILPGHYATPVLADELAGGWLRAFERRLRGVLHLGGTERVSQLRFARRLAAQIGADRGSDELFLLPTGVTSTPNKPLHGETSLCSRQARDLLGWRPAFLADTIGALAAQRHTGRWEALGRPSDVAVPARAA